MTEPKNALAKFKKAVQDFLFVVLTAPMWFFLVWLVLYYCGVVDFPEWFTHANF